ncbi:phage antirepressor protein [Moraxella nonliquefaciens]|uniref:BRO-N domain-containing protein n=1 Tax=Moraxella nonliquefaciens TaxID=478 RepID=UPI001EF5B0A1|nr:BRO family protein [Moraxella nonliquefaciens]MCG7412577.1 phage antirepressor protein [Moraxella nonliquefaciens]
MNTISVFQFQATHNVRIVLNDNGEPLFCLTDVATILDISNANPSRFSLDEAGIHKMYISHESGKKLATFINEPNLYRVIFRSNKAEAVKFQNWVFDEVLPSIRKTGQYTIPTVQSNQLSDKDWTNLKRLVWLCENNFKMQGSAGHAIWARLRAVTGVKSPQKFSREHLPILAVELERIFRMSELYGRVAQATEKLIIRNVLKYGDDEPMEFFLAEMVEKATDYNQAKAERLPKFFDKELLELVA